MLQNANVTNAVVSGLTSKTAEKVSEVINALGRMIGGFKMKLSFKPSIMIGSLAEAINTKDPSKFITGAIEITGQGGYDGGSIFSKDATTEMSNAYANFTTGDLIGGKKSGSSKSPAPRSSGSGGSGGGKSGGGGSG